MASTARSLATSRIGFRMYLGLELARAAAGHDPAGVDEPDVVAVFRLVQVVGGDEDGDAAARKAR